MVCLVFPLKGEKLGLDGEKADLIYDVVNLKVNPKQMDKLLEMDGVFLATICPRRPGLVLF